MIDNKIGLNVADAQERLIKFGKNKLNDSQKKSVLIQFFQQFLNPLILVLLVIAGLSFFMHEFVEGCVILIVVLIDSIIGFIQERKAEHAVDSIKRLISLKSKVYRDGDIQVIDAENIVPGDVVVLEAGDKVPADGILLEYKNLQISEAQLTGEAYPVLKSEENTKAFMSTIVTNGRGLLQVESTGMSTEIGKITNLVSKKSSDKTPLEIKFKKLTHQIIYIVLFVCGVVFLTGLLKGYSLFEIFEAAVSLGASCIPEGLPIVVTVTLAIGVLRMSRQNSIIKNLPSASTLAGVDVICTDKTGTITEGKIKLSDTYVFKSGELLQNYKDNHFIKLGVLCNDANIAGLTESGDLLDIALLKYAEEHDLNTTDVQNHHTRLDDIPFDSEYKYHATLNKFSDEENIIVVKGAFDVLIDSCLLNPDEKQKCHTLLNELAEKGLRIILLGSKYTKDTELSHEDIIDLDFNGLLVFLDPLRDDVYEAILKCRQSGISTVMITGDHVTTAKNIAIQAGIAVESDIAMEGEDFRSMDAVALESSLNRMTVIARAAPMDKVLLVDCFNSHNKTVAMTGDGVNDAPALVKADIGIAMGDNGTDAAREAADMILLDDKFSTIVRGIEEARVVYENLKKVVTYLFSTSLGEILTIFISILLGLPLPLIAVQILWLNLITDGFLTCAVALDGKQDDIMGYKPERYKKNILDNLMISRIVLQGLVMSLGAVLIFQYALQYNSIEYARTSILIVLAIFQWFNAFNARSEDKSIFSLGFNTNMYIVGAVLIQACLLILAVYTPLMQSLLKTVPVEMDIWIYSIAMASTIIAFEEIRKAYYKMDFGILNYK